ncbi:sporulation protein [Brevibacillus dissolubilis]|uniref:sporulation protein n=1 Tax=Brevibacillus dissolubilis TaxID=1844116 RepID=UPI0011165B20|nr:sporulation protein [Brevibacillus dissolubilis]
MSMFKKMLASVGIGSAKVDARLFKDEVMPGDEISGEVHIFGGDVEQNIDEIYMYVVTYYERESNDTKYKEECLLLKHRVTDSFVIKPKENRVVPFSFKLPYDTPLTMGRQPVYLRTGLDIKVAMDPGDSDFINVKPHPLMTQILTALGNLDFQIYKVDCEYNHYLGRNYPFIQEFEFRPKGKYRDRLEELEVIFYLSENELEVLLQLDKRARGFHGLLSEAFDLDERYARIRFTDLTNPPSTREIEQILLNTIDKNIR